MTSGSPSCRSGARARRSARRTAAAPSASRRRPSTRRRPSSSSSTSRTASGLRPASTRARSCRTCRCWRARSSRGKANKYFGDQKVGAVLAEASEIVGERLAVPAVLRVGALDLRRHRLARTTPRARARSPRSSSSGGSAASSTATSRASRWTSGSASGGAARVRRDPRPGEPGNARDGRNSDMDQARRFDVTASAAASHGGGAASGPDAQAAQRQIGLAFIAPFGALFALVFIVPIAVRRLPQPLPAEARRRQHVRRARQLHQAVPGPAVLGRRGTRRPVHARPGADHADLRHGAGARAGLHARCTAPSSCG